MKRFLCVFILILSFALISMSALAGSIPEDLLHYDGAQLYFGTVKIYGTPGQYVTGDFFVEVTPTSTIKGDVPPKVQTYTDIVVGGNIELKEGKEYLVGYFDENNPAYIFEASTKDTKTMKLTRTDSDMWDRLEKYLNDGEFEKAELARKGAKKAETASQPQAKRHIDTGDYLNKAFNFIFIALALVIFVSIFIRILKNLTAREKEVSASVIAKESYDKRVYSIKQAPHTEKKYIISFDCGKKKMSFEVSEFSYPSYKKGQKGRLIYKGNRIIEFIAER